MVIFMKNSIVLYLIGGLFLALNAQARELDSNNLNDLRLSDAAQSKFLSFLKDDLKDFFGKVRSGLDYAASDFDALGDAISSKFDEFDREFGPSLLKAGKQILPQLLPSAEALAVKLGLSPEIAQGLVAVVQKKSDGSIRTIKDAESKAAQLAAQLLVYLAKSEIKKL
jgi:hypothetical protein